ncbi:glycosyltransferase family 4 protein [Pseudocitrobacter sp. 73]|uniref:glycosyltransferase family 4 protein n=1 Tax=Pseudocitrobacter sp. 73 TaxID=2605731 RepID=UPI0011EF3672|nr:glycosyltransferase family 4 protein [Pseudocitrobacter sp. 73]KAA1049550.1 glycosyltransferase family 4 protein [Pseudocitrobacter sp. 73]
MNIIHVITHGGWAGSETIAAEIANEQARRGHNITVILRKHEGFKERDIVTKFHSDISIFWVKQNETHPDNQIKTLLKNEQFVNKVHQADVLHAHLPYGCLLGKLLKDTLLLNFLICVSMHVRFHPLYYLADKLFTVAKWQRLEVPNDYTGEVSVIENFLCPSSLNNTKRLKVFKNKHHISDGFKYIVYIGRLDLVKGPDVLIRAFNKVNPAGYKLLIVGDGAEAKSLKSIATENVIFTGKILDASFVLELADIAVVPSRFESFGLILLEVINAKKRVIATNIPSFREILGDGDYFFDNESVNSLAGKIEQYINFPMIGYAEEDTLAGFSLEFSSNKLEEAYFVEKSNMECVGIIEQSSAVTETEVANNV